MWEKYMEGKKKKFYIWIMILYKNTMKGKNKKKKKKKRDCLIYVINCQVINCWKPTKQEGTESTSDLICFKHIRKGKKKQK